MNFFASVFAVLAFFDTVSSNPCTPNPCENFGVCSVKNSSPVCQCVGRWYGPTCSQQDICGSSTCINGGYCSFVGSLYGDCKCPLAWTGSYCEESRNLLQHDFESFNQFTSDGLSVIQSSVNTFPATAFEGTTHYGSIKPGSTFFLSSNNVGNDGSKYCVEFGYFMYGENVQLDVIQHYIVSGTPKTIWQQKSDSVSGSLGSWQKAEFTFQGQTGTTFFISGSTENSGNGILAVDQIKTYKGNCV